MTPLYRDPWYTFRLPTTASSRFHLQRIEVGRQVSVFKVGSGTGERFELLATAIVGDGGSVDLAKPIKVRADEAFIAGPEPLGSF